MGMKDITLSLQDSNFRTSNNQPILNLVFCRGLVPPRKIWSGFMALLRASEIFSLEIHKQLKFKKKINSTCLSIQHFEHIDFYYFYERGKAF